MLEYMKQINDISLVYYTSFIVSFFALNRWTHIAFQPILALLVREPYL